MSLYTITFKPVDGSGAQTTVCVDVNGSDTRITELTVRAARGGGLPPFQMPALDLELLQRAIGASATGGSTLVSRPSSVMLASGAKVRGSGPDGDVELPAEIHGRPRASVDVGSIPSAIRARPYRRVPDDLNEVYQETRSVTAVSKHYGVPRHTAQGWMNRLRERGRTE